MSFISFFVSFFVIIISICFRSTWTQPTGSSFSVLSLVIWLGQSCLLSPDLWVRITREVEGHIISVLCFNNTHKVCPGVNVKAALLPQLVNPSVKIKHMLYNKCMRLNQWTSEPDSHVTYFLSPFNQCTQEDHYRRLIFFFFFSSVTVTSDCLTVMWESGRGLVMSASPLVQVLLGCWR